MTYRITGIDPASFRPLVVLDDAALEALGARRMIADSQPGYPCRVTLEDAALGETLILVPHAHMTDTRSPYRASGPVFVREGAAEAAVIDDAVPPYLATRLISLRAYDEGGLMVDAEIVEGRALDDMIRTWLAREQISYCHAHFARRGCFAAKIERT